MAYEGPRFRRDLISTVFYEGGVRCVDVHDPKRGATFRLFDYEYSVALAFDGRDLGKVISWVRVSTGLELNEEQLTSFARRLDQLGFLEKPKVEGETTPPPEIPSETPAPLPVPRAPSPPPPRDETTPPPEAGSLATATRSTSGERLASTGTASTEPSAPPVTTAPESEPLAATDAPTGESTSLGDSLQAPAEDAIPEPIAPDHDEPPPTAYEEVSEASELPGAPAPTVQEQDAAATAAVEQAPAPVREEPVPAEAAPVATAPLTSSSEPELPVAVGPSPARIREHPAQRSARLPTDASTHPASPAARRQVTPPPIPQGHVTPTPLPVTGTRRGWMLSAFFGILAALVVGTVVAPFALGTRPPAPVSVRVMRAQPSEVVRWTDVTAPIEEPPLQTLSFPRGGKVLRIASPGLELRPGDVVAATDAARSALTDWAHAQEQLAFARQLVEGLRDSDDEQKIAAAQATVTQRLAQQERAYAAVSKVAITATEPSTVAQTLASLGQTVQPGSAAVRLRLPGWRVRFELNRLPAAQLRKQGLCLAEISGRPVSCSFLPEDGDDTHLVVSLPTEAVQTPGLLTHLARSRILNAYVLPPSALSDSNGRPRVLVVAANGRTEMRSVVMADRTTDDVVVTQGLDPGDAVVIESSRPVGAGTPVRIVENIEE